MTTTVPLSVPLYGASLPQALSRFFRKYATFSGRASRAEYWWIALVNFVVLVVSGALALGLGAATGTPSPSGGVYLGGGAAVGGVLGGLWFVAVLIPSLAVTVRRLHDVNLSGWLILLNLVPSVGSLIVFILTLLPPSPLGARFDADAAPPAA